MKDGDNTEILAEESGPIAFKDLVQEIVLVRYAFVTVEQGCYTCLELHYKLYAIHLECKTSAFQLHFLVKDEVQKVELWRSKDGKA